MGHTTGSHVLGTGFDANVRPDWLRTGYQRFPYAAQQSGQWWVLRLNHGFPEHDLYTLFVDGTAAADITATGEHPSPLVASVAALTPADPSAAEPHLDADTAAAVVQPLSHYVNYGSEHDDPCLFCSEDYNPLTPA
jgi:hypothetical protein